MIHALARPQEPVGQRMIKEAEIRNFRCFKSVKLTDCRTMNVVLGRNASGKTALLESIFLTLGNTPEVAQRLRQWRGLPANNSTTNTEMDWEQWSDLFRNFDPENKPSIILKGDAAQTRSLSISYDRSEGFKPFPGAVQMQAGQAAVGGLLTSPLKFEYKRPGGSNTVRMAPMGEQIAWLGTEPSLAEVVMYPSYAALAPAENVERFSRLLRHRKTTDLIKFVCSEFPFIENIEVANAPFGGAALYLDIPANGAKTLMGLVSGGVAKIISALTAIAAFEGGVIILDEIENGIYYDRYESLWGSIYRFAKANRVQVFASTHNQECLKALAVASRDWVNDVSFIRTIDTKGEKSVEQFHGATIFGAMKIGEIR